MSNGLRRDTKFPAKSDRPSSGFDGFSECDIRHGDEYKTNLHFDASDTFIEAVKAPLTMRCMEIEFKAILRRARKAAGMTQQQVADALKVKHPAVNQWETGKTYPSTDNLFALANLLGPSILNWKEQGEADNSVTAPAVGSTGLVESNVEYEQGPFRRPRVTGPHDIEELGVTMGGDGEDDAAFEMNGQVIDRVKRPIGILDRKNVYALRVTNTSMWPRFKHGVRVYIEDRPPAIEDHVVIELKPTEEGRPGKSFIKLLTAIDSRKITVEQYNPRGILEFGRHEIKKVWRVIPDEELRGDA
ncbi:helix-turn-helix domain-containing protein [Bosea spartocytisi]|nr:helix-turn-helix domain-containing protein [Bosea spartocytisi]MCT4470647.1 helix-turn-helix domain-containing protein [Bosea spartocytisi]